MEVKGLFRTLLTEKFEYLYKYLPDLRIQFYVVFTFLTHFYRKKSQRVFYFFIAFGRKVLAHLMEAVKELEHADKATYDFNL